MTALDRVLKRLFDIFFSMFGLLLLWPVILISSVIAGFDTKASGFFRQKRVGRYGHLFEVIKLRTMRNVTGTKITTLNDARITKWGAVFRRYKLDELPQLWNVLKGDMSFVGPRPDMPGYLDQLTGDNRVLLELRPGITGPASLKYKDEEKVLAEVEDAKTYNDNVIWPDKIMINVEYYHNWSLSADIGYILRTLK